MKLYEMKLHDAVEEGNLNVVRVPGGWIYSLTYQVTYKGLMGSSGATQAYISTVFVPYSEEYNANEIESPEEISLEEQSEAGEGIRKEDEVQEIAGEN